MKEEYYKWYSPNIGKETEMLVFGDRGYPVIVFPTSMGSYMQNRDFKLIEAAKWYVDNGLIKIYCPDSFDNEGWYNNNIHPAERVRQHMRYDRMIMEEVVTRAMVETGKSNVAFAGCSFGGYHAANFAFRYPEITGYMFSMGGAFDIKMHMDGYYDENVYFHNPTDYIGSLNSPHLYDMGIVLGYGEHDFCAKHNIRMSDILNRKGIPHWHDIRPNGVHDWPVWREMFPHYLSMIKF